MARISKSWEPELTELEQELLNQDSSDRQHADTVAGQALTNAKSYADTKKAEAISSAKSYTDTKKAEAISAAASDATSKASTAETNAKSYADTKKSEAITYAREHGIGSVRTYANNDTGSGLFRMNGRADSIPVGYSGYSYGSVIALDHGYDGGVAEVVIPHSSLSRMYFRGRGDVALAEVYTTKNLTLSEDKPANGVGVYVMASISLQQPEKVIGDTVAGSYLSPANTDSAGATPSGWRVGTWRCMGRSRPETNDTTTLWLRIA
jgi:hypothetical protein